MGTLEPEQQAHQGRLAGAVGADQGDDLLGTNVDVDVIQHAAAVAAQRRVRGRRPRPTHQAAGFDTHGLRGDFGCNLDGRECECCKTVMAQRNARINRPLPRLASAA